MPLPAAGSAGAPPRRRGEGAGGDYRSDHYDTSDPDGSLHPDRDVTITSSDQQDSDPSIARSVEEADADQEEGEQEYNEEDGNNEEDEDNEEDDNSGSGFNRDSQDRDDPIEDADGGNGEEHREEETYDPSRYGTDVGEERRGEASRRGEEVFDRLAASMDSLTQPSTSSRRGIGSPAGTLSPQTLFRPVQGAGRKSGRGQNAGRARHSPAESKGAGRGSRPFRRRPCEPAETWHKVMDGYKTGFDLSPEVTVKNGLFFRSAL